MKILLAEYVTGGGLLPEDTSSALLAEGTLMLEALALDLLEITEVTVAVLLDRRVKALTNYRRHPRLGVIGVPPETGFEQTWRLQLAACDAVWPIAPESDGILERLGRAADDGGTPSLGCPPQAVAIAASKHRTASRLAAAGVAVVPTRPLTAATQTADFPLVLKPDDGVGCGGSRIIRNRATWSEWWRQIGLVDRVMPKAPADPRFGEDHTPKEPRWVMQPLLVGEPLSLSAIFNRGEALLLCVNRQWVREHEGGFILGGCTVNALPNARDEFQTLGTAVARALPELWGYAGIDLVRTAQGPIVLEVNPRLTTSYAGLRQAMGINVASIVCALKGDGQWPRVRLPLGKSVEILLEH